MLTKSFSYADFSIDVLYSETDNLWTAYQYHLIYDTDRGHYSVETEPMVFDHEPSQEELDSMLCMELGIDGI